MEEMPVLHTKWCGKHWIHLDEVASTNDYLKQGDFADGTAVIADRQTAGKGRPGQKLVRSACRASDVSFGAFSFYENQ